MADIDDDIRELLARLATRVPASEMEDLRALKTNWLYCLLVRVRDDTAEDIRRNVERCVPVYLKHDGLVVDMTAWFQLVAFGVHGQPKEESRDRSRALVNDLMAECRESIRIVAFDGEMAYGNIGTDNFMSYSILIPKFDRFLVALLNTEFGHVTELGSLDALK
jgi:hypothetical protein